MSHPMKDAASAQESPRKRQKKEAETQDISIIFGVKNRIGVLQEATALFTKHGLDLSHIESRPASDPLSGADFDFFVTIQNLPKEARDALLVDLKELAVSVIVLDDNSDTTDPMWFPRKVAELDAFATRVLDAGEELTSDHPGFTDPVYRERRKYFADIAIKYKHGTPIPRVDYSAEETSSWTLIYNQLKELYPTHACKEFNQAFPLLEQNCGFSPETIPQLEDINSFLQDCTGFRLRPVAGLLTSRDFLAGLAFRVFHSTQYIRHHTKPLYTPEPDVCHELLGHVPLFANKEFAEFSQEIGLASLGASDEEVTRLATTYWFTIEFGLCKEDGAVKAYGAGLLSSFGELKHCLSDVPTHKPFDPAITSKQEYPITEYQPIYFVADSFSAAKEQIKEYASKLKKPFQVRYNPYTQSIELLENASQFMQLAKSIQNDMALLQRGLSRRASGVGAS